MDDSENPNTVVEEGVAESTTKKRPRKKHLYNQIMNQMEFYFSDANLGRDRFLSQLLQESKNVPLDVFLRFNKIRALTSDMKEIAKALGKSQLLNVTEDGTHVYRTTEVRKKENQDDCMIYVEQLPPDANHEWLSGIFSAYGKVEYVSIPKYKNKAVIKGFAFVEFDTPEAAKKALEAFGSVGCTLPPQMPPGELCSIASYDAEEGNETDTEEQVPEKKKKEKKKSKQDDAEEIESDDPTEKEHEMDEEEPRPKKMKLEAEEQAVEKTKKKKKKHKNDTPDNVQDEQEDNFEESEVAETTKCKKSKKRKMETEDAENMPETKKEAGSDNDGDSPVKKKKKKKPHVEMPEEAEQLVSPVVKKKKRKQTEEGDEGESYETEKADDEGTRKRIRQQTDEDGVDDDNAEEEEEDGKDDTDKSDKKKRMRKRKKSKKKKIVEKKENDPTSLGLRILSKTEWRRLRNKYLNLQREKMQALKKHLARAKFGCNYQSPYPAPENGRANVKPQAKPESSQTQYTPGAIIHVELSEPIKDLQNFKSNARRHEGIKYVDANEGESGVYVRCGSSDAAQKLVAEQLWENMEILKGEAEEAYWKKIWEDRKNRFDSTKKGNTRGRDKLLKRAERDLGKYIKFDD